MRRAAGATGGVLIVLMIVWPMPFSHEVEHVDRTLFAKSRRCPLSKLGTSTPFTARNALAMITTITRQLRPARRRHRDKGPIQRQRARTHCRHGPQSAAECVPP